MFNLSSLQSARISFHFQDWGSTSSEDQFSTSSAFTEEARYVEQGDDNLDPPQSSSLSVLSDRVNSLGTEALLPITGTADPFSIEAFSASTIDEEEKFQQCIHDLRQLLKSGILTKRVLQEDFPPISQERTELNRILYEMIFLQNCYQALRPDLINHVFVEISEKLSFAVWQELTSHIPFPDDILNQMNQIFSEETHEKRDASSFPDSTQPAKKMRESVSIDVAPAKEQTHIDLMLQLEELILTDSFNFTVLQEHNPKSSSIVRKKFNEISREIIAKNLISFDLAEILWTGSDIESGTLEQIFSTSAPFTMDFWNKLQKEIEFPQKIIGRVNQVLHDKELHDLLMTNLRDLLCSGKITLGVLNEIVSPEAFLKGKTELSQERLELNKIISDIICCYVPDLRKAEKLFNKNSLIFVNVLNGKYAFCKTFWEMLVNHVIFPDDIIRKVNEILKVKTPSSEKQTKIYTDEKVNLSGVNLIAKHSVEIKKSVEVKTHDVPKTVTQVEPKKIKKPENGNKNSDVTQTTYIAEYIDELKELLNSGILTNNSLKNFPKNTINNRTGRIQLNAILSRIIRMQWGSFRKAASILGLSQSTLSNCLSLSTYSITPNLWNKLTHFIAFDEEIIKKMNVLLAEAES